MILPKPFTSLVFLACIVCIVVAQIPSENNNSTEIGPTTTAAVLNGAESISSSIVPTTTSSSSTPVPLIPSGTSSSFSTTTTNNNANALPTVQSTGWNSNGNTANSNQQSWLKENNRFVFIIFVGLLFLGLLIWYIVRSVKGMRTRLEQENQAQLYMIQQASAGAAAPPQQQPFPPQQQQYLPPPQQQQYNINEVTETPPPAYKTEENTPSYPPLPTENHGQPHH